MKDIDGYVTKDDLYRLISRIKRNPDVVVNDKTYHTIVNAISDMPSTDVQPVKHGRWLPSDSCITAAYGTIHCQICSECGADLMEDNDYDYDFCPVCGTRMDLKGGDEE